MAGPTRADYRAGVGTVPDGWLTITEAAARTGASPATLKRYATRAVSTGQASRIPLAPGKSKLKWLLAPEALDAWHRDRPRQEQRAAGPAAPPSVPSHPHDDPSTGVPSRLDRLERTLTALTERMDALWAVAADDVQAARTAALAEKTVSERLRAAQRAQEQAAAARASSQRFQEEATAQARVAADKEAEAAAALGQALDDRSAQLDQLLTPGSPAAASPTQPHRSAPKPDDGQQPTHGP